METPSRLSQKQAEAYLPATPEKLKNLRHDRKIKYYKVGHRSIVYDRASIDAFLNSCKVEGLQNV